MNDRPTDMIESEVEAVVVTVEVAIVIIKQ